jgi:hypothetical protein
MAGQTPLLAKSCRRRSLTFEKRIIGVFLFAVILLRNPPPNSTCLPAIVRHAPRSDSATFMLMKKSLVLATTLLALAAFTFAPVVLAALNTRSYTAATQVVSIDGVGVPEIVAWSGGEPTATVVLAQSPGAATPRKSPGPITYTPIVLEAAPPFSPALQNCVAEFLGGTSGTTLTPLKKTLLLSTLDGSGQPAGETLQATGALLTEIHFPALDASARTSARVKFVFRPDATSVSATTAPTAAGGNTRNTATSSNFLLTLTGLPANNVTQIDAFILRRDAIPDLTLTLASNNIAAWQAWRDAFFPGHAGGPVAQSLGAVPYKDGTLQLLSPDGRTPLFTLQLAKVGLKRLAQQPAESGALLKFRAELFCESMNTAASAPAPAASTPLTAATPAKVIPREIDPTKTLTTQPIAASTKTPATVNASPDDKGARDPANFPRPPDVVRTSFSASREPTLIREYVYYTGKTTATDIMSFYEKSLEADGWKESSRNEDNAGSGKTYRITSNWTKDQRTASLVLGDVEPGKVEIYAALQERK